MAVAKLLRQVRPIETGAGIVFPSGGNVFVASQRTHRMVLAQLLAYVGQLLILHRLKGLAFKAFEFNANREVVAVGATVPLGRAGMPGPCVGGYKLQQLAGAPDHKVAGDVKPTEVLEVGVGLEVEQVGKQLLNGGAAIVARWQADGVHDHQVDHRLCRSLAPVGRRNAARLREPAIKRRGVKW